MGLPVVGDEVGPTVVGGKVVGAMVVGETLGLLGPSVGFNVGTVLTGLVVVVVLKLGALGSSDDPAKNNTLLTS